MTSGQLPSLPVSIQELPGFIEEKLDTPLQHLFEPFRHYEAQLRQLYAQEPDNPAIQDPNINVLPVFTDNVSKLTVRARDLKAESAEEKQKYVMPLPDDKRKPTGSPAVVQSLKEFQGNLAVFSESSLVDLDWSNVVAAGSSVVNCLLPVPDKHRRSKRALREYYHEKFCPASDVDLFLYGLTEEEAFVKIKQIETAIRDSILTETTTVRTKNAITICSQYPTRHVQIVLRIYKSVSEILTGFDIDCSGAAYDGKQVYCTPRALQAYLSQINHIDLTRRSPSYENRLSKYSHRNFEVYWPDLDRTRIDPTIFERSFQRTLGLARLLVLERLPTTSARKEYLENRRRERGRPPLNPYSNRYRGMGGNIKEVHEDEVADWVEEEEVSNYHTFTIPYGPRFHAKKIEKLCYTRDLLLNAEWNQPKDRDVYLHRHPAFFGRVDDVIHDCCGFCPVPRTEQEKEVAQEESKIYVSGEVSFMRDDPGRQQIGSFNPLTENDWTEMAYVGNTARLCQAIVDGDLEHVEDWLCQEGADPNQRDHTGRTPLHLAVVCSTLDVVQCLVDHGARLVARLADGRTALHLAAERGNPALIKTLMEKSLANEAEEDEKATKVKNVKTSGTDDASQSEDGPGAKSEEDSEEDSDLELLDDDESDNNDDNDHSIATGSFVKVKKDQAVEGGVVPEEGENEPDIYDINVTAWDIPCSALHLAILSGHEDVVRLLVQDYGADVLLPVRFTAESYGSPEAMLTLLLAVTLPAEQAASMARLLINLGVTSAQADRSSVTAFHRAIQEDATEVVETLMEVDPTGTRTATGHLVPSHTSTSSPLQNAVTNGNAVLVTKLLEAGATPEIGFDAWLKSAKTTMGHRLGDYEKNIKNFQNDTEQPLILALQSPQPETALALLARGADPNTLTKSSHMRMGGNRFYSPYHAKFQSALDLVREQLEKLHEYTGEVPKNKEPVLPKGIDDFSARLEEGTWQHWVVSVDIQETKKRYEKGLKEYKKDKRRVDNLKGAAEKKAAVQEAISTLERIEADILSRGGKPFKKLHPEVQDTDHRPLYPPTEPAKADTPSEYGYAFSFKRVKDITEARKPAYIKLFEAAWQGESDIIKSLTLASWGAEKQEAPLEITVQDEKGNSPFSLAFLRGHYATAQAILEIAQAQYVPEENEDVRYRADEDGDDEDSEYDSDSDEDMPRYHSVLVDEQFTIDNIGEVSMQVKSRTKPLDFMDWQAPTFRHKDGEPETREPATSTMLEFVIKENDLKALRFLLSVGAHFAAQKLDPEDEPSQFYPFPDNVFRTAVGQNRTELLAEIIRRTGAGLPLEELVRRSGVGLEEKPRYYQGLTVYGKKRKDWAAQGRRLMTRPSGSKTSPLLIAAKAGCIESVEWFLSDTPARLYVEFGKSKAAREDSRLKHLTESPGGFEAAVSRWLGNQNDLVIHAALMAPDDKAAKQLVEYLIKTCPQSMEAKTTNGQTSLWLACQLGRVDLVKLLIDNNADQTTQDANRDNLLHAALAYNPSAAQLAALLDLVDSSLLRDMHTHRTNARAGQRCFGARQPRHDMALHGTTPLHAWVMRNHPPRRNPHEYQPWGPASPVPARGRPYAAGTGTDSAVAVLRVLLASSAGAGLELLNGAGETVLHTLVSAGADPALVRALLDFRPALLHREDAVGRTPAELARDLLAAEKVSQWPTRSVLLRNRLADAGAGAAGLLTRPANSFAPEGGREDEGGVDKRGAGGKAPSRKEELWRLCEEFGRCHPDRRRLVGLHEANDVARRLGEVFERSRYYEQDGAGQDAQDQDPDQDEGERKIDFVLEHEYAMSDKAWHFSEKKA